MTSYPRSGDAQRRCDGGGGRRTLSLLRGLFAADRVLLVCLLITYSLAGALLFMKLEQPREERAIDEARDAKRKLLAAVAYRPLPDLHQPNWTVLVDKMLGRYERTLEIIVRRGVSPGQEASKWSLWNSLLYSGSIYTTVGYGNVAPSTSAGRLATMAYATLGIPLCMILLSNLASSATAAARRVAASLKDRECCFAVWKALGPYEHIIGSVDDWAELAVTLITTALYALTGASLYLQWESWTIFEAIYFIAISLTTVGFGDVVPQMPCHFVLSSAYVFFGLALVASGIGMLQKITSSAADLVSTKLQRTLEYQLYGIQTSTIVGSSRHTRRSCASFYAPPDWHLKVNLDEALHTYQPPEWAVRLKQIPLRRVRLAQKPTPIEEWGMYGVPNGIKLSIKRDDLTGSTLSGNKVRKLEFVMADCLQKQCRHVITCGSIQSNHCRSVAVAGAQLGLKVHVFLRTDLKDADDVGYEGNLLLNRLANADIYLVPRKSPYKTSLLPRMEKLAAKLRLDHNEASYLIPLGGSDAVGLWGYIECFHEMLDQGLHESFDDLVVACGTGGTAAGIALGNYLNGSKLKCHAIAVCDSAQYFHAHINDLLDQVGILDIRSELMLNIIEGHKGKGYGLSTEDELAFVYEVARTTGIILDPTYTGKAAYGLWKEMQAAASVFKGRRVLFVHTGGLFGTYDMRIKSTLLSAKSCLRCGNSVKLWED